MTTRPSRLNAPATLSVSNACVPTSTSMSPAARSVSSCSRALPFTAPVINSTRNGRRLACVGAAAAVSAVSVAGAACRSRKCREMVW